MFVVVLKRGFIVTNEFQKARDLFTISDVLALLDSQEGVELTKRRSSRFFDLHFNLTRKHLHTTGLF